MKREMTTLYIYVMHVATAQFTRMHVLTIFLLIFVAEKSCGTVVPHGDPSACQRVIKFMLINACGATKREFHDTPQYIIMSDEEIERRYHDLVQAKSIKGVEKTPVGRPYLDTNLIDDGNYNEINNRPLRPVYRRLKRSVIRGGVKTIAEAIEHDRRGSFTFIGRLPHDREDREDRSPPPGELKTKCCGGPILCTMDDFRGFCE